MICKTEVDPVRSCFSLLAWLDERVAAANVKGHNLACSTRLPGNERDALRQAVKGIFCLSLTCGFQLFIDESKQTFFKHLPCLVRLGRIQMHRQASFTWCRVVTGRAKSRRACFKVQHLPAKARVKRPESHTLSWLLILTCRQSVICICKKASGSWYSTIAALIILGVVGGIAYVVVTGLTNLRVTALMLLDVFSLVSLFRFAQELVAREHLQVAEGGARRRASANWDYLQMEGLFHWPVVTMREHNLTSLLKISWGILHWIHAWLKTLRYLGTSEKSSAQVDAAWRGGWLKYPLRWR